jgi:protein-disulfide isomerase
MSKREEIRSKRRKDQQRRLLTAMLIVGGIAVVIAALVIYRQQSLVSSIVIPEEYAYPESDGVALGDPDAPVVIEEFSDFQCPACQFFHDNSLFPVVEEYVSTGKVYYIYRQFPIIDSRSTTKESQAAALASYCAAEQDQFWPYHDVLFANQIGENVGGYSEARLMAFADLVDVDTSEFRDCLREERYRAQLEEDFQRGVEAGVNSTPTLLINGQIARGAIPYVQLQQFIESELAGSED